MIDRVHVPVRGAINSNVFPVSKPLLDEPCCMDDPPS